MNGTKSIFISAYVTLIMIAFSHACIKIVGGVESEYVMAWLGVIFATGPHALFFMKLFLVSTARTSANLNTLVMLGIVGASTASISVLQMREIDWLPLFYAVVIGLGGNLLYVFWYSRFGRGDNPLLRIGNKLPKFTLEDPQKNEIKSNAFIGSPCLIVFYRGNWCPLCVAQIKEIAGQYKAMVERGVKVVLVSPQSHENTELLAKKFDVPFLFLVDKNNEAAKKLNIASIGGTPTGLELLGYESDTVMPTVVMTDAKGKIIFADLTDNYRVRPEPETYIRILEENGISISS
ncbi:MAG: peroxiredoxin family protein [Pseudomonadales bacterium]|nr:peroxiredoxin family protein [Pseudomonadales bacterium]